MRSEGSTRLTRSARSALARGLLLLAAMAGGCGNPAVGSSGSDGGVGAGSFSVTVDDARQVRSVGVREPGAGRMLVVLGVTLRNHLEARPLPASQLSFAVQTAGALVHMALPESQLLAPACPVDVAVAMGGAVSCRLAFELADGDKPAKLLYSDLLSRMTSAAVPALATLGPVTCADFTKYEQAECLDCLDATRKRGGSCDAVLDPYYTECEPQISNGCIEPDSTGCLAIKVGCKQSPSAACQSALKALAQCRVEQCSMLCI